MLSFALVGCSGGGGGGGATGFNPNEKPQNAAEKQYVDELVATLSKSEKLVPSDVVVFDSVLDGTTAKDVTNSDERKQALAKLSPEGQAFVKNVRAKCVVNNANVYQEGLESTPKVGSTIVQRGWMNTRGSGCPYIINEDNDSKITYTALNVTPTSANIAANLSATSNSLKEILDETYVKMAGVRSMAMNMTMNGAMTAYQDAQKVSQNANYTGNGSLKIILANSDVIQGPIQFLGSAANEKQSMQFLFDGTSPKGAIRIVGKMTTETGLEIYVNGEKVDASAVGGWKTFAAPIDFK